jgi:hypothetical protein
MCPDYIPGMLKKRRSKKDNVVKVTFELPPETARESVRLMADFDDWQGSHELKRQKDGRWRATVSLPPGEAHEFRYLVDGSRWVNEPEADRFVRNAFGDENSVVLT